MVVGVGSFSDPPHLQGLSHLLEHMLFMGSDAFPDENEYDAFLSRHGGSSNAYTELVRGAWLVLLGVPPRVVADVRLENKTPETATRAAGTKRITFFNPPLAPRNAHPTTTPTLN
jgi:hypothetical protein